MSNEPFARIRKWHFHWNVFRPKNCIGGKVYVGWWAETERITDGERLGDHVEALVRCKQDLGVIEND